MRSGRNNILDHAQPALIVLHGHTAKKYRPLAREAMLLGSASCCDIGLDATGVLPVHCVIIRQEDGYHARNCAPPGSTRLNGESFSESLLHDGDILQAGAFSFQVQLPSDSLPAMSIQEGSAAPGQHWHHLASSRRNLAQLALGLRRRLTGQQAVKLQELDCRSQEMQEAVQRWCQQEEEAIAERLRRFANERQALDQDCADLERRLKQAEQQLSQGQAADAELAAHRQHFLSWRQQEEERIAERVRQLANESQSLDQDCTALQRRLGQVEEHLARRAAEQAELQAQKEELLRWRQQEERGIAERLQQFDNERQAIDHTRATLKRYAKQVEERTAKSAAAQAELQAQKEELLRWRQQEEQAIAERTQQLSSDRQALDRDRTALEFYASQVEQHLDLREAAVEDELQARKQEFERWRQEQQQALAERTRPLAPGEQTPVDGEAGPPQTPDPRPEPFTQNGANVPEREQPAGAAQPLLANATSEHSAAGAAGPLGVAADRPPQPTSALPHSMISEAVEDPRETPDAPLAGPCPAVESAGMIPAAAKEDTSPSAAVETTPKAAPRPTSAPQPPPVDIHELLCQRMAMIRRTKPSRLQKLFGIALGKGSGKRDRRT